MTRTRALMCVTVVLAIGMGLLTYGVLHTASRQGQQTREALHLAREIQQQRTDATLQACRDQNHRHNQTIKELDRLLRRAERGESKARRAQIKESRASTVLLIAALAPHRNCKHVVAQVTQTNHS